MSRTRPGNLGLVVMRRQEVVRQILAQGPEQLIQGVHVRVHQFDQQQMDQEQEGQRANGKSGTDESTHSASTGWSVRDHTSRESSARRRHNSRQHTYVGWESPEELQKRAQPCSVAATDIAATFARFGATLADAPSSVAPPGEHSQCVEQMLRVAMLARCAQSAHEAQRKLRIFEEKCHQNLADLSACSMSIPALGAAPPQGPAFAPIPPGLSSYSVLPYGRPLIEPPLESGPGLGIGPFSTEALPQPTMPADARGCGQWWSMELLDMTGPSVSPSTDSRWPRSSACSRASTSRGPAQGTQKSEHTTQAVGTLRSHLVQIQNDDASCIFVVRRINKLGFRSQEILWQHYSQYGEVAKVLVAHSSAKLSPELRSQSRARPGGLGIIVMRNAQSVKRILSPGEAQRIAGHEIHVQSFVRPKVTNDSSSSGSGSSGRSETSLSGGASKGLTSFSGRDGDVGSSDTSEGPSSSP